MISSYLVAVGAFCMIKLAVIMLPRIFGHKLRKKPIALLSKFVAAEFEIAAIK